MTSFEERLRMEYTTLAPEVRDPQALTANQSHSLYKSCQPIVDGRAARGKQYESSRITGSPGDGETGRHEKLVGSQRLGPGSARVGAPALAVVLERDALCQYLQVCFNAPGQSTGQRPACGLAGTPRGAKPLRGRTQPAG